MYSNHIESNQLDPNHMHSIPIYSHHTGLAPHYIEPAGIELYMESHSFPHACLEHYEHIQTSCYIHMCLSIYKFQQFRLKHLSYSCTS